MTCCILAPWWPASRATPTSRPSPRPAHASALLQHPGDRHRLYSRRYDADANQRNGRDLRGDRHTYWLYGRTNDSTLTMANVTRRECWSALQADKRRYQESSWLGERTLWWVTEPTFWAVTSFRLVQALRSIRVPGCGRILRVTATLLDLLSRTLTGIELGPNARIGPGLRIWHGRGLVVNSGSVIGDDCVLRQGVTIGNNGITEQFPVLGRSVDVGAYAQIIGGVHVGDNARIGAHAVVLQDVPAGSTAVGVPARVISSRRT